MKINYVVSCYITDNHVSNKRCNVYHYTDKYLAIKYHVQNINQTFNNDIVSTTFVVNTSPSLDKDELENVVNKFNVHKKNIEIVYRENVGGSYMAHEYHIRNTLDYGYDYYFLTEDDYYLCNDVFYSPFIKNMDDNVGFVCGLYWDNHPAVSYKLISGLKCKKLYDDCNEIFFGYNRMNILQSNYHLHFLNKKLVIRDVSEDMPIIYKRINDLIFLNKIRYTHLDIGYFYESYNINQRKLDDWSEIYNFIKIMPLI